MKAAVLRAFGAPLVTEDIDLRDLEQRLQGSQMGSNRFRLDIPRYARLYMTGRLDLDTLVSGTVGLDDVNNAFADMISGDVARQIVIP